MEETTSVNEEHLLNKKLAQESSLRRCHYSGKGQEYHSPNIPDQEKRVLVPRRGKKEERGKWGRTWKNN